jgi:hypothetical protein
LAAAPRTPSRLRMIWSGVITQVPVFVLKLCGGTSLILKFTLYA